MTDQILPLRLLNSVCYLFDSQRPFMPTFPVMGMGHGPYTFLDGETGQEVIEIMHNSNYTAYSEFGSPGPSPAEYIRGIIPDDEIWPPNADSSWRTHHAFQAWTADTWLCWKDICKIYGEPADLEELCQRGAELQAIGYQAIYEEARRQWPRCSMAINWCFNEPWPSAANNSIVNYPAPPKPIAFAAVRDACRDQLLCARVTKLSWRAGEVIEIPVELINDSREQIAASEVIVSAICAGERFEIGAWQVSVLVANERILGPCLRWTLPELAAADWQIELRVAGNDALHNSYRLRFHQANKSAERLLNT
ncbi:MAG: hypothetical protein HRU15_13125 [Planctomycetes bacterium]|nr:hypothetical protein [Planctomycetota bacterium]